MQQIHHVWKSRYFRIVLISQVINILKTSIGVTGIIFVHWMYCFLESNYFPIIIYQKRMVKYGCEPQPRYVITEKICRRKHFVPLIYDYFDIIEEIIEICQHCKIVGKKVRLPI